MSRQPQRKRNIECSRPEEPAFLKKLKARIGFQGNAIDTVDKKNDQLPETSENDAKDRDDEQPVYVVTDNSAVSEQELDEFKSKVKFDEDELRREKQDAELSQKILFKKPTPKDTASDGMKTFQSTKKSQSDELESKLNRSKIKSVSNSRLLSFDDDEEQDED